VSLLPWQQQLAHLKPLQTDTEALEQLRYLVNMAEAAKAQGNVLACQTALEDTLAYTLLALDRFKVNTDNALHRVMARWQKPQDKKRFRVYADFVEIWVGTEYRGGWPLTTADDRNQVVQLATELSCELEYAESRQLSLLNPAV
jgi:hypothetical protein